MSGRSGHIQTITKKELTVFRKISRAGEQASGCQRGGKGSEEIQGNCTEDTWTRLWEVGHEGLTLDRDRRALNTLRNLNMNLKALMPAFD